MKENRNTSKIGNQMETVACQYLTDKGIVIRERNFRCKSGEIDIIGYDGSYLVFFEVKYRRDNTKGTAAEAVHYRKQETICKVSDYYRMIHHIPEKQSVRYDVIAIDGDNIRWIKNAFAYHNRKVW